MAIRAVLFDVGGPLDTETAREREMDGDIRSAVAAEGRAVTDGEYADANAWAVASFAPNTYQAIIWRLLGPDREACARAWARVVAGADRRTAIQVRPGIPKLLAELHGRGLKLGLAANQPASAAVQLDALGLGRWFHHREVSGTHGYRKPDVRLFLRACADLGVEPEACVMVGDRIDNDIAPARLLGMRTVLLRTGRHIAQQPRSLEEVPDAEVWDVAELRRAVLWLTGEA
jgi:HAD superfamily hydrolase (TIGR01509 family)